ncbi:hypothetical protein [Peribacillus huizhouensis]|uniref:Uncharacterized protein n=1 Tax=Peribacillus huizhouensis TaxID=1501239 RepID=A0ABR6CQC9_9BACI|nr:hypothetical protein [Peribacillus huizhouensis]MBA9026901.1 hypothetical protein [Peribacillus huizhouensis]
MKLQTVGASTPSACKSRSTVDQLIDSTDPITSISPIGILLHVNAG